MRENFPPHFVIANYIADYTFKSILLRCYYLLINIFKFINLLIFKI